jgi:hypothetical protein
MEPFGRGRNRFDPGFLGVFSILLAQPAALYFSLVWEEESFFVLDIGVFYELSIEAYTVFAF